MSSFDRHVTANQSTHHVSPSNTKDDEAPSKYDKLLLQLTVDNVDVVASDIVSLVLTSTDATTHELRPESVTTELYHLWASILAAAHAQQAAQPGLVAIMAHLASLPDVNNGNDVLKIYDMVVWRDMPMWGWEINDEWNHLDIPKETGPARTAAIKVWHAQNHFSALLFNTGIKSLQAPLQALWTFRIALENDQSDSPGDVDVNVPAAAIWIKVAGGLILACDTQFPSGGKHGRPGSGGKYWTGQHGYCRERWDLWKARFGTISQDEQVNRWTREEARSAAATMREFEALQ